MSRPLPTNAPPGYESKFSEYLSLLHTSQETLFVVHHPETLGDTYDELVESLNRLADAGKQLMIVPRAERQG